MRRSTDIRLLRRVCWPAPGLEPLAGVVLVVDAIKLDGVVGFVGTKAAALSSSSSLLESPNLDLNLAGLLRLSDGILIWRRPSSGVGVRSVRLMPPAPIVSMLTGGLDFSVGEPGGDMDRRLNRCFLALPLSEVGDDGSPTTSAALATPRIVLRKPSWFGDARGRRRVKLLSLESEPRLRIADVDVFISAAAITWLVEGVFTG